MELNKARNYGKNIGPEALMLLERPSCALKYRPLRLSRRPGSVVKLKFRYSRPLVNPGYAIIPLGVNTKTGNTFQANAHLWQMMLPPAAAPLQLVSPLRGWPPGLEVALLRSDLVHGLYGGNKYYKLYYNLLAAAEAGLPVLTFGGAFSNHIAAVAAAAREAGIAVIGIIRGDELDASSNEVLHFAASCGMQLQFVSRTDYRRRHDAAYHRELEAAFGKFYLVPEGGTNALAVRGFQHILPAAAAHYDHIFTATGTGGTLAGLAAAAQPHQRVTGIAAVNDAANIITRVAELLQPYPNAAGWELNSNFTFGGYARTTPELDVFCREVSAFWHVPLEPVYTGKLMFAVDALVGRGELTGKILILHSGGIRS